MNYDAQMIIQNELASGERLLWAGIPKQGMTFRSSDLYRVPISILYLGFAIFWEISVLKLPGDNAGAAGLLFPLFGLPIVLVGLHLLFGRFIYDSKKRKKSFYGLTDQRAIIVSGIFKKGVQSLNLKALGDVSLSEKKDGSGTIVFGQEDLRTSMFSGFGFPARGAVAPKFEMIENARQVYSQLREQQKS